MGATASSTAKEIDGSRRKCCKPPKKMEGGREGFSFFLKNLKKKKKSCVQAVRNWISKSTK